MNVFEAGKVLLINKPYRWTSFDAVNKIKWAIKKKYAVHGRHAAESEENPKSQIPSPKLKVGHAGTLDPLATGLLIICTGKFTKKIEEYQAQEKEYTGTFFLGATTPCFDLEKPIDKAYSIDHITEKSILDTTKIFIGKIQQVPPLFS